MDVVDVTAMILYDMINAIADMNLRLAASLIMYYYP